mmetsp:Transcript_55083/g.154969  ORF Transcript_55083/g.154969 Transcript_55083/m.154969 type:complete len:416 (+) Transcript_55083:80-1327(+)
MQRVNPKLLGPLFSIHQVVEEHEKSIKVLGQELDAERKLLAEEKCRCHDLEQQLALKNEELLRKDDQIARLQRAATDRRREVRRLRLQRPPRPPRPSPQALPGSQPQPQPPALPPDDDLEGDPAQPSQLERALAERFSFFSGGPEMDGWAFRKCLKRSGVLDRDMTARHADAVFARHRPRGGRRIDFGAFQQALLAVARRKGVPKARIVDMICGIGGPRHAETPCGAGGPRCGAAGVRPCSGNAVSSESASGDEGAANLSQLSRRGLAASLGGGGGPPNPDSSPKGAGRRTPPREAASPSLHTPLQASPRTRPPSETPSPLGSPRVPPPAVPMSFSPPRGPERFFYDKRTYTGVCARRMLPEAKVVKVGMPTNPAFGPERFFYDKSTYTGIHASGAGPHTIHKCGPDGAGALRRM